MKSLAEHLLFAMPGRVRLSAAPLVGYRRQDGGFHRGSIPRRTPRGLPRRAQRRAQGDQAELPNFSFIFLLLFAHGHYRSLSASGYMLI
jgi:hypothetical protein